MGRRVLFLAAVFILSGIPGKECHGQDFDVEKLIRIHSPEDVRSIREALAGLLFGETGFPCEDMPDSVEFDITDPDFAGMANLKQINRLVMEMEWGLNSIAYMFVPRTSNHQLVIYHQGHNGSFALGKKTISAFLKEGFHVVGMSMPLLGMNRKPLVETEEFGKIFISTHDIISYIPPSSGHPVRYFPDPVVRVVNFVQQFDFDRISMVGISGGGWTTTLCAALDPRIEFSFPVAGSLPMYLRIQEENRSSIGDYEQYVPEIYRIGNYLELYILGAYGAKRRQTQILNEFDDCCFWGTGYKSYEGILIRKMEQLGKGSFNVILDSSHREHKISDLMIEEIMNVLESDVN